MKERDYTLDAMRIIACVMVILMHSPMPNSGMSGMLAVSTTMLTMPCIGLFFMVSGHLLFPVRMPMWEFLRKRLNKVVWPTVAFSLFYIIINAIVDDGFNIAKLSYQVFSIPFSTQGHGILWFMYVMIGLYLISPIISPFLESASKQELQLLLILWGVTLLWPYLQMVVSVNSGIDSMLHYYCGYAGYFVGGYYLKRFPVKVHPLALAFLVAMPFGLYLCFKIAGLETGVTTTFSYLSLPIVLMTFACHQLVIQYINIAKATHFIKHLIKDFSNCSFGIYLIHIFIMRRVVWEFDFIKNTPPILQIILTTILTIVISWAVIHMLSYAPFSKYIIGYNRNIKQKL